MWNKCAFSITYTRGILGNSGAYDSNWNKVTSTVFSHSHWEHDAHFKCKLSITSIANTWRIAYRGFPRQSSPFQHCGPKQVRGGYGVVTEMGLVLTKKRKKEKKRDTESPEAQVSLPTQLRLPPSVPCLSLALPLIFQQSPGILWGAPRGDGYSTLGRCTPTLSSHILHKLVTAV